MGVLLKMRRVSRGQSKTCHVPPKRHAAICMDSYEEARVNYSADEFTGPFACRSGLMKVLAKYIHAKAKCQAGRQAQSESE